MHCQESMHLAGGGRHKRAFCMHGELLNDRLITDYHVTMIGYGKPEFGISRSNQDVLYTFKHHSWEPEVEVILSLIVSFTILCIHMWA